MTISVGQTSTTPSVARQVARATVATLAVVAVAALGVQVATNTAAIAGVWWRVAGDRDIRLADGVVLPHGPLTVDVPLLAAAPWRASDDVARLAAVTGQPVRPITAAESEVLTHGALPAATWRTDTDRRYATPAGVVVVSDGVPTTTSSDGSTVMGAGPSLTLFTAGATSPQVLPSDPAAALTRLVEAWGVGAGAPPGMTVTSFRVPQAHQVVAAYLATPEVHVSGLDAAMAVLDPQGRLVRAQIELRRVAGTRPMRVVGADVAFEQVRHHQVDSVVGPATVTGASLEADSGDPAAPGSAVPTLYWAFSTADGMGAWAPAQP